MDRLTSILREKSSQGSCSLEDKKRRAALVRSAPPDNNINDSSSSDDSPNSSSDNNDDDDDEDEDENDDDGRVEVSEQRNKPMLERHRTTVLASGSCDNISINSMAAPTAGPVTDL